VAIKRKKSAARDAMVLRSLVETELMDSCCVIALAASYRSIVKERSVKMVRGRWYGCACMRDRRVTHTI
jgi:hypothetical protein